MMRLLILLSTLTVPSVAFKDCRAEIFQCNGTLTSPGYPHSYPPSLDCKWDISVTPGHRIQLEFDDFDVETIFSCDHDYIEIIDYFSNETVVSRNKFCGSNPPPMFVSADSDLTVVFHSDSEDNGLKGFKASWKEVKTCGGKFITNEGYVMSPNFPGDYPPSQYCRWEIKPYSGARIHLHFDADFGTEYDDDCAWDFLEIFLGATKLGRYCGHNSPSDFYIYPKDSFILVFKSDNHGSKQGFFVTWKPF